jgi:hypothetical protein
MNCDVQVEVITTSESCRDIISCLCPPLYRLPHTRKNAYILDLILGTNETETQEKDIK